MTVAMILANKRIIPPKEWYHDPKICDNHGWTVAIYLLKNKLEVPEEWRYDPEYKINYNFTYGNAILTTSFILAIYKVIPPKYFEHDPNIKDKQYSLTVAMILAKNGIIPPR